MKVKSRHTKAVTSKGDRLKWTPLKKVKPVSLTAELTKGRQLTAAELKKVNPSDVPSSNVFVP